MNGLGLETVLYIYHAKACFLSRRPGSYPKIPILKGTIGQKSSGKIFPMVPSLTEQDIPT